MESQLNHRDTATYVAFALGEAMLNAINAMFPNAKKFLNEKDVQKLNDVVDSLWV